MLNFFTRPIEVSLGDKALKFFSLEDFEFGLASKTTVPSDKVIKMMNSSLAELTQEASSIKEVEKHCVSVLAAPATSSSLLNQAMYGLDTQNFSQDHDWRALVSSLYAEDIPQYAQDRLYEFRRIALAKYIQYLSARQELIRYICIEKRKQEGKGDERGLADLRDERETANFSSPLHNKDTACLFDENTVFQSLDDSDAAGKLSRMPKGETIRISLRPGEGMALLLSKYECQIIGGPVVQFLDNKHGKYSLKSGKNVIGRDTDSTVVMDAELRDISRLHLVIEVDSKNQDIQIMDLSSHGTFIPSRYMEHRTFP